MAATTENPQEDRLRAMELALLELTKRVAKLESQKNSK